MNTELFTVSRIFTESLYRIPDYQRGYSWRGEQLKDFWLDLEQLEGENKHYTGVLTLEDVPEERWSTWDDDRWIIKSRRYHPYYVVDGQQRLTTVIILLQCILEATSEGSLNFTPIADIRRKYVFDLKTETSSRSYLFGYERDNPSYEFLKKNIFKEASDRHHVDEETIYTKNLLAAKEFFGERLKDFNTVDLEILFTKVTQQLVFNVYEISNDIDVFVTFETMNNRGKPLSTLELLKNRLIFLSTRLPLGDDDGPDLRRAINDSWKTIYHYLGKNDSRPLNDDDFLRTHLSCYYLKKLHPTYEPDDEIAAEMASRRYMSAIEHFSRFLLNDLFTPKRIRQEESSADSNEALDKGIPKLSREFIYSYSQNIKAAVELYYKLSTPEESSYSPGEKMALERIGRLRGYNPSSFLLALYTTERDAKKRLTLIKEFERWLFCRSLVGRTPYAYRRLLDIDYNVDFISGKLSTEQITTQMQNMVAEMFKEASLPELVNEWVKNGPSYYSWRTIKYFLFEYELHLKDRTKSNRDKILWNEFISEEFDDDYHTIEHIYPQRARDKYWTERFGKYSPSQKRLLRNSLGNLLPLAKRRNSSLGNKSFTDKKGDDKLMTGYRYGSYSEIQVSEVPDWGAQQILERGIQLLEFMETRWNLPFGDRQQKIKALGLEFMTRDQ